MVLDNIILNTLWTMKKEECDVNVVANSLNQSFVNVGPDLEGKIPDQRTSEEKREKLINRNPHSMFLKEVDEREIVDIVIL